jgi:hypothetical protein
VKAHDLARQLLAGPDNPTVVPTYDDQDHEQHVEVTSIDPLPARRRWYDTDSARRQDPAVKLNTADEHHRHATDYVLD